MLIYHWSPPLCENLPSKRVYLSMRNISIAKCCFFSSISPHNCLTIHPTRYLRAICTIFWHPASYILHEIPGRGLFHLFGQFSADCEAPSVAPFSSEIAGAIPSSKVATSGASRLAEILPVKVKKAPTRYFMQNITRWMPKDCANRPQISCKLGLGRKRVLCVDLNYYPTDTPCSC